jgi:RNA polymerase sigma-70 factor (ECF subfamily)
MLVANARRGKPDALAQIYAQHKDVLYRVALGLMRSWADAEDIVQEVLVGLPEALRRYRGDGPLEGWLVRVTTRTALMELRRRRRRRRGESLLVDWGWIRRRGVRDEVDRISLDRALAALPETQRAAFLLKEVEGYSHDEIAEMLGITTGASRARFFRAARNLRSQLAGNP